MLPDGGRRMRRAKNRTVKMSMNGSEGFSVDEASTKQLMAAILQRDDIDATLKALLLHILSK